VEVQLDPFGRLHLDHQSVRLECGSGPPSKIMCGGWRNWITIWVLAHDMALPLRSRKGTSCQRQLSMYNLTAPKVAVLLSGGTPGSSRYLPILAADRVGEHLAGLHNADRIEHLGLFVADGVASKREGASMAVSVISCSKWFWNMSRSTPTES